MDYKNLVAKGKDIVDKIRELEAQTTSHQAQIAKYATQVCTIRHGGISTDLYTIKDYAEAIGLNSRTVQNWVQVYRNVITEVGITDPTPAQWLKASKVNTILKLDRSIENKNNDEVGSKQAYNKWEPKTTKDLYEVIDKTPFIRECNSITNAAKHAKHILGKRDLSVVADSRLIHLMELLDDASDIINEYLTSKQRQLRVVG